MELRPTRLRPTRLRSLLLGALLPAAALLFSGCATGFTGSSIEDFGTFRIDVTNDLAPRVEIFLVTEEGGAAEGVLLGSAPVEGTTTFRIDLDDPAAAYRLRAAMTRGRELLSDPFVPVEVSPDATSIRWVLADNVLGALEAEGEGEMGEAESSSYTPPAGMRRPTGARLIPPSR